MTYARLKPCSSAFALALLFNAPAVAAQTSGEAGLGTTVVGEQDAPIGLFVNPWKEHEASTTDRPPRLYDVPFAPVDAEAFRQAVGLRQSLDTYRLQRLHR